MRNDLTADDRDNGAAAVTLARLHRTLNVGETDDGEVPVWDFEADPHPIIDTRLSMGMPADRLAGLGEGEFRVVWYGDRMQAADRLASFRNSSWLEKAERISLGRWRRCDAAFADAISNAKFVGNSLHSIRALRAG